MYGFREDKEEETATKGIQFKFAVLFKAKNSWQMVITRIEDILLSVKTADNLPFRSNCIL